MKMLSQRDPLWASVKMGQSDLTLGKAGCTTTVVSMISDDFGCFKSPLEIAHNVHNYTEGGYILWQSINEVFKVQMRFVWRGYGEKGVGYVSEVKNLAPIMQALANPNQRVALQVNDGAHWVKLVRKNAVGKDWTAIDPWTAKECQVLRDYHNITGFAIFEDLEPGVFPTPAKVPPPFDNALAKRLSGKLLISVEEGGRLYFVDEFAKLHNLGSNAMEVQNSIAKLALGITKADLSTLPWA